MLGISKFNYTTQQQRNTTQPQRSALQSQPRDSFTNSKKQQPNFKGFAVNDTMALWCKFRKLGLLGVTRIDENGRFKITPDRVVTRELPGGGTLIASKVEASSPFITNERREVDRLIRRAFKAVGLKYETMPWPRQEGQ